MPAYEPFDKTKPDGTADGAKTMQDIRINQDALIDNIIIGSVKGWDDTHTYTGDDLTKTETQNGVEIIKQEFTYVSGDLTTETISYSPDSGGTYELLFTTTHVYSGGNLISSNRV